MAREPAPPVDPAVRVPRAVREGAERASAAQYASIGQAEPPVIPPGDAPAVPSISGEPAPPPAPSPPAEPAAPPSAAAPAPAAPPAPTGQEPPADEQSWEHRYKTVVGRAEADRRRAREAMDQMSQRIHHLEGMLAQAVPPAPAAPQVVLTPEEINDYGEDFVSVVRRVAESVVDGKVAPLASELGRTRAQVGVTQNQTMHQQMTALQPQWQQLNSDQRFIDWVLLPDPYSGVTRQKLMQEAWNAGDARRVNAFFQGFLTEEAALNPAGVPRQPVAPAPAPPPLNGIGAPAPVQPPLNLADLAAPGGVRSVSQGVPTEKPIYTTADITRFYTEVAAGKWRTREADRAAIDADISRAQHEGRIIQPQTRYVPPNPPQGFTR